MHFIFCLFQTMTVNKRIFVKTGISYICISLKSTHLFDHKDLAFATTEQMKASYVSIPFHTLYFHCLLLVKANPPMAGPVSLWPFGCLHLSSKQDRLGNPRELGFTPSGEGSSQPTVLPHGAWVISAALPHSGQSPQSNLSQSGVSVSSTQWPHASLRGTKRVCGHCCLNAGHLHPSFSPWQRGKWSSSHPHTGKYKTEDYSYYNCLLFEIKFKGLSSLINLPAE